MEAPDERFAALLGGREATLACEELVLRARADADAGRDREAALQARIALESLLSEMEKLPAARRQALEEDRGPVGQAANAALRGPVDRSAAGAVEAAVARMEAALRAPPPGQRPVGPAVEQPPAIFGPSVDNQRAPHGAGWSES